MTVRTATLIAAAVAAGCTWGETSSAPVITGVATDPGVVVKGTRALVTVTVSGLEPDVVVDFDVPERSRVCTAVHVELRAAGLAPVALRDARVVSPTEVLARLEGDADKVLWDLAVVDPSGREATLADALDVGSCLPPNGACDDGDDCTVDDRCNGTAFCAGGSLSPDGTDCLFACTTGERVAGRCAGGACQPLAGECPDPVSCDPN